MVFDAQKQGIGRTAENVIGTIFWELHGNVANVVENAIAALFDTHVQDMGLFQEYVRQSLMTLLTINKRFK